MNRVAIRAAIHVAAVFAIYLSAAMLIPAAVDLYYGNKDWRVFAFSALFMGGLAMAVALATHGNAPPVTSRFGFLLVNLLWLTMALAGTVPFLASSLDMSITDAVFESVSGITTTGSTVINGLDHAPPGLLMWRSLLSFMGGLGVIALGLFLLPFLNIGGISYFKIESSDIEDRPFERFQTFTLSLIGIYTALVIACAISYAAAGMDGFHAVNHAMSTVATGGFSTHDTSFLRYADNPAILWIGTIFMFIGGLPFSIMILFAIRGRFEALRDPQIRVYAGYCVVFAVAVAIYLRVTTGESFFQALTQSTFNFMSLITTAGFASQDYTLWGPFAVTCVFVATFLGGCSGSTTGGIKAYRFLILFELMANGLRRLIYPNTVIPVRYGDRSVPDDMQRAVVLFISSFLVLWAITTVLLGATGLDFITALTGSLTSLTNVGPGLGPIIGPVGNFSSLPDAAKWICSAAMLLGRLEILAVLVIFTPTFWGR
ncbi:MULTISPECIES: TrkH family potassium uptake protein [unclassified Mesorhizobium]|uniref:TrkH family potassium uptake protein n=1 Tax=unclassified Mesorhizobium TaxID=325217 RepID=UPI0008DF5D70|nr:MULTISPECIES: TrkH family potassium uptake protein [unclassified Mesorhizobium]RJG45088.1 TrkH family potassium uptake protein [Mesorhizobium sp. DCY119]SFT89706.1 trk system potassium uptake protein TrkH [Mesorhizobium sp. YR577]